MQNRILFVILGGLMFSASVQAQDLEIVTRPEAIYVERLQGNITPMERVFFHIVLHNASMSTATVDWVRFDLTNSQGVLFSGQYSGPALMKLFDSAIDRKRIEPTPKQTLEIGPDQRKALSDVFFDCPVGFIGESMVVEVQYQSGGKALSRKISTMMTRAPSFTGRLPFDGIWFVENEHGYLDQHKRYLAEAFAYDFIQIGANGKSYQRDGTHNADYYAYGKKVLAAKDGTVVFVRTDIVDNDPGRLNVNTPGGNVVVIDHGDGQYGYYAHMRPNSIALKVGAKVKAGDILGDAGNSGDSTEPGIHFHVMNNPDPNMADGIPAVFANWKAQSFSEFPENRELGVLPKGEFVQP